MGTPAARLAVRTLGRSGATGPEVKQRRDLEKDAPSGRPGGGRKPIDLAIRLVWVLALCLPAPAWALGLGNAEVKSALNEPLSAKIALRAVQSGDLDRMLVALGTAEQFALAGIDRPFGLSALIFKVVDEGPDRSYIRISTVAPVTEPFLNFLVEVNWARGRVIREYTILLDPPVYGAAISAAVEQRVPTVSSVPRLETVVTTTAEAETPAPTTSTATPGAVVPGRLPDSIGPVTSTDTLWSIAERVRPDASISVQRMMLSILEANPEAFAIANVNALKAGSVLRIPGVFEIGPDEKAAALAEVRRHHAQWDDYRRGLAAATPRAPAGEGVSSVSSVPTGVTDSGTPAPGEPAQSATDGGEETEPARLELVSAGSATDGTGAAGENVEGLRNELNMALEEADAKGRESEELASRLTEAEEIIADLQRMVEIKDSAIATLQRELAKPEGGEVAPAPAEPAETPKPEPPKAEPGQPATAETEPPKPDAPAEPSERLPASAEPSILTTVQDMLGGRNPIVFGAFVLGVLTILIGAIGLVRKRRSRAAEEADALVIGEDATVAALADDGVTELGDDDATVVPGVAPGVDTVDEDATVVAGAEPATVQRQAADTAPDEDPLSEVNVYLAYERFDQAESVVRGAIGDYPDRHEYRLRLLEVFHQAKNLVGFEAAARELRDKVGTDSPLMEQAAGLWQGISPGRDLFAEAADDDMFDVTDPAVGPGAGAVDMDLGVGEEADATSVDFDLGFEITSSDDVAPGTQDGGLDFDLGVGGAAGADAGQAVVEAPEEAGDGGLDFDLGDMGDLGGATVAKPAAESGTGLDFDLGDMTGGDGMPGPSPAKAPDNTTETQVGDSADLDFDLGGMGDMGEVGAAARRPNPRGRRKMRASKLPTSDDSDDGEDSGLDFDLGDGLELPSTGDGPEIANIGDIPNIGGIPSSGDIGDGLAVPEASAPAEASADQGGLEMDVGDLGGLELPGDPEPEGGGGGGGQPRSRHRGDGRFQRRAGSAGGVATGGGAGPGRRGEPRSGWWRFGRFGRFGRWAGAALR